MELRKQIARAIVEYKDLKPAHWWYETDAVLKVIQPIIEERDKLRAEIEATKNQEPACWVPLYRTGKIVRWFGDGKLVPISLDEESALEVKRLHLGIEKVVPLYLAPGAQPAAIPEGWSLVLRQITEQMHVAACKEIVRSDGLDGLPQRMLDAMLAAAPNPGDKP